MFEISQAQMEALQKARWADFEKRLVTYLESRVSSSQPDVSQPEGWLRAQVARGIAEAVNYRLRTERQIATFVEITCVILGGFPSAELPRSALAILCSYGADPDVKLERYRKWAEESRSRSSAERSRSAKF